MTIQSQSRSTKWAGRSVPWQSVKTFPNPLVREYHFAFKLSDGRCMASRSLCQYTKSRFRMSRSEPSSAVARELIDRVLVVPGVTEVSINGIRLRVVIGLAFEWGDVEPRLADAISEVLGARKTPLLIVERYPDRRFRGYHLSLQVSNLAYSTQHRRYPETHESLNTTARSLVNAVDALPGVSYLSIDHYCLVVVRKSRSSWKVVDPAVIDVLREVLGLQDLHVQRPPAPRLLSDHDSLPE